MSPSASSVRSAVTNRYVSCSERAGPDRSEKETDDGADVEGSRSTAPSRPSFDSSKESSLERHTEIDATP